MSFWVRLRMGNDLLRGSLILGLPILAAMAFGGLVWWAGPLLSLGAGTLVLSTLLSFQLRGRWSILISPMSLPAIGVLAIGAAQLVPLPAPLASQVAPEIHQVYATGTLPELVRQDDPEAGELPEATSRTPATLDRSATLRATLGALLGWSLFWAVAHYVDHPRRLVIALSGIVVAMSLNVIVAWIQVAGTAPGLYGAYQPGTGSGPVWAPTLADAATAPGAKTLEALAEADRPDDAWPILRPALEDGVGTMFGGSAAVLALASIALPVGLGLSLHGLAPRGSRDPFAIRFRIEPGTGPAVLLYLLVLAGAGLCGWLAGPWLVVPIGLGLLLCSGIVRGSNGLDWAGPLLSLLVLLALGLGAVVTERGWVEPPVPERPLVQARSWAETRSRWAEAVDVATDYPRTGVGLDAFAAIQPYYKTRDLTHQTASSSLLQWWAETGWLGMALLGVTGLGLILRLPWMMAQVGSADSGLVGALVGGGVGLLAMAAVHWTWQLPAVALSASVLAGAMHRWLAGGTDAFATG